MCGIVASAGYGNVLPELLDGLSALEYRGYDSAGVALVTEAGIRTVKKAGRVDALRQTALSEVEFEGTVGIAHTRWATHGAPSDRNTHPHSSFHGKYTLVHNGIIENHRDFRASLTAKGITFQSDTDSEVVAHLLEQETADSPVQALRNVCEKLRGSFALCVLCTDTPDTFYCAKMASPLLIGVRADGICAASDLGALGECGCIYRMQDGEFAACTADGVTFYNRLGQTIDHVAENLECKEPHADTGEFSTFMEKEIYDQPLALQNTISREMVRIPITPNKVILVGCGSAYHAAMAGALLLEASLGVPCRAIPASEFRYNAVTLDEKTLTVCISQSGETADTLAALRKAKAAGAQTLSIVNVPHSALHEESRHTFLTEAGREISVATTKAYTAQLAALLMLCGNLSGKKSPLEKLPGLAHETLNLRAQADVLSKKYIESNSVYFIGRGTDLPTAMEGALKMRELSYIDAHAYPAGELKHGTISLVRPGTLCVAVCCSGTVADKTVSNMEELRARGARLLCVTTEALKDRIPAEDFLTIPDAEPALLPILATIPLQFFAYFTAKHRNCDIDKPRNLAKSVTVE